MVGTHRYFRAFALALPSVWKSLALDIYRTQSHFFFLFKFLLTYHSFSETRPDHSIKKYILPPHNIPYGPYMYMFFHSTCLTYSIIYLFIGLLSVSPHYNIKFHEGRSFCRIFTDASSATKTWPGTKYTLNKYF